MSQPTARQLRVDAPLTNLSIAYMQSQEGFIAGKAAPVIPVDNKSDEYFKFRKKDWFKTNAKKRASSTESAGGGFNIERDTYACDRWEFHHDLDDYDLRDSDSSLDLDNARVKFVMNDLLLRQEVDFQTNFLATGIWATDKVGTTDFTKWSTYATSVPVTDIKTGRDYILQTTGYKPNTLILGYKTFAALEEHPTIIDKIKYTKEAITPNLTRKLMAGVFDVEQVLVASAVIDTANEGAAASLNFIAAKMALLAYVNPTPGKMSPSAMYQFGWKGVSNGLGKTIATRRIRIEERTTERVEAEAFYDQKVVGADLGYFFDAAVA